MGEPSRRFDEDALRILRAARFSAALGFEIEKSTLRAALESLGLIESLSGERVREELTKLLCAPGAGAALEKYAGIVLAALPELPALPGPEDAPPSPVPRWAALLRDTCPETARGLLTRLRFSNREITEIIRLIRQLPLTPKGESLAERLDRAGLTVRDLAVSGGDLVRLGYAPGPGLGAALDSLLTGVISGGLQNRREVLLRYALENM